MNMDFTNEDGVIACTCDDRNSVIGPGDIFAAIIRLDRPTITLECWEWRGHSGYFDSDLELRSYDRVCFDHEFRCWIDTSARREPVEVNLGVEWNETH